MITKILAAYDGSEPAGHAYRFALHLAKRYGADLLVLAVASPPEPPADIETEAVLENAEAHYGAFRCPEGGSGQAGAKPAL
jgi:nucleotide-binding universal stress UspA family protein